MYKKVAAEVSEIELLPIRTKNGLTFFASCVLDEKFFVGNIAVYTRRDGNGFRCVYPTKVLNNGKQIPIFYPINNSVGREIENAISKEASRLLLPEDRRYSSDFTPVGEIIRNTFYTIERNMGAERVRRGKQK